MRKNDLIFIVVLLVLSGVLLLGVRVLQSASETEDGTANVFYRGELVLQIELADGSSTVHNDAYVHEADDEEGLFVVEGELGPVTIAYADHTVEVVDETSPRNICQHQGRTNSPYKPLTCLPNDVVIRIERAVGDDYDGIVQ